MDKRAQSLQTVIVIVAGLLVFYVWLHNPWLLRGALAVALTGVFSPWLTAKIHAGWMLLAQGLGWFNGRVLLSAVFFIILTPFAWLARLFGSSSFLLRKKQQEESYYAERNHTYTPEDLEHTW